MQLIGGGNSATIIDPLIRALRAAIAVILHTILGAVCASSVWGSQLIWNRMFSLHEPTVAGLFPLRYIPELGEAAIFLLFVAFGLKEAWDAFNSK
jgi:hypothetical protein